MVQSYFFGNNGQHAIFQNPSIALSGRIWVRVVLLVVVVVVVTTGKQSQLPGLAWDGSLTKVCNYGAG